MKINFFLVFLFLAQLVFGFSNVPVEIQWEEIPNARKYELEIQNKSGQVVSIVKSKTALFRFKIKPGQFLARCRALDSRGVPGDWSELTELSVTAPRPQVATLNQNTSLFIPEGGTLTELSLQWPEITDSSGYEIELRDSGGKITTHQVSQSAFKIPISTGSYQYRLKAIGTSGEASDFTDWSKPVTVSAPPLQAPIFIEPEGGAHSISGFNPGKSAHSFQVKPSQQGALLIVEPKKRGHLSSEWKSLEPQVSKNGEISMADWLPGEYRLELFFRKEGFPDSIRVQRMLTIKPTEKSLLKALSTD